MTNINACLPVRRRSVLRINAKALSEHDILVLNDKLLTAGFHDIEVENFALATKILTKYFSLLHFKNVACLGVHFNGRVKGVFDLYTFLKDNHLFYDEQGLNEFLLSEFDFDFLWIEWSKELVSEPWFAVFKQKLIEYEICDELPVVMVMVKGTKFS